MENKIEISEPVIEVPLSIFRHYKKLKKLVFIYGISRKERHLVKKYKMLIKTIDNILLKLTEINPDWEIYINSL